MSLGEMTIKVKLDKETIDRFSEIKSSLEELTKKINLLLDTNNSGEKINPPEEHVELLPERLEDTKPLTEVALDNPDVIASEVEKDANGNPVFHPWG